MVHFLGTLAGFRGRTSNLHILRFGHRTIEGEWHGTGVNPPNWKSTKKIGLKHPHVVKNMSQTGNLPQVGGESSPSCGNLGPSCGEKNVKHEKHKNN